MPRSTFGKIWGISLFVAIFEGNLRITYVLISQFALISQDMWLDCFLLTFIVFNCLAYIYLRLARCGMVTAEGLTTKNGPVIPFEKIEQIINEGRGYPSVVLTPGERVKMHLRGKEYARLAKTTLNQWAVDGDEIIVKAGEPGQALSIKYSPVGKFKTFRLVTLFMLIFLATTIVVLMNFDDKPEYLIGFGIVVFLSFVNSYYKRVRVTVEGDMIRIIDEKKAERGISFSDVSKVEKGLFRNRIMTKNGEAVYVPQACIILPELIEEFQN